jgi:hypothetical protein
MYICTHFCTTFSLLTLFPPLLPSTGTTPPGKTCSTLLFSNSVEEKREDKMKNMVLFLRRYR